MGTTGDGINANKSSCSFSGDTVSSFDNHVKKAVPFYDNGQKLICEISDYFLKNEAYKKYISQYSKEYIEMSEWYYGPELPYDIYIKEFRKEKETYLDNKESIKELYSLFMFYGLLQYYLPNI